MLKNFKRKAEINFIPLGSHRSVSSQNLFSFSEFCVTRPNNGWERELQKSGNAQKNYLFFSF